MTSVKEFLLKGRHLKIEIEELKEARQEAFELACSMSVSYSEDKVQTSSQNSVEQKFISYTSYSEMLDIRIRELTEYRQKMLELINKVDSSIYRSLLIARYIDCKSWEKVAEAIGYSDKWVRTGLHSASLKAVQKVLNK